MNEAAAFEAALKQLPLEPRSSLVRCLSLLCLLPTDCAHWLPRAGLLRLYPLLHLPQVGA